MIQFKQLHDWNVTPQQAIALQKQLAPLVSLADDFDVIRLVAGVDVGFEEGGAVTRAAVAVLKLDTLECVDQAVARRPTSFPYVPGLLSFREIPAVLDALAQIRQIPDLLLCDGQGVAHPRRLGIAAHLGLITDLPSVGVGKSRLIGTHAAVPENKGSWVPLFDKQEMIGAVLRSRDRVAPLYISAGHKIGLASALMYVQRCLTRYRLPETTRWAHKLASGPLYDSK